MRFPEKGEKPDIVMDEIRKFRKKDLDYSRILGTMCSQPEKRLIEVYADFLETNLGDPKNFPGTKEIEDHLIGMILDLFNAPSSAGGRIVSGGTEGNMLAIAIAKNLSRGKEVIVPDHVHFSFQKIAKIMDVKLKIVKTKNHVMDVNVLSRNITKDTLAVVAVAGTTELGLIDPIPEISDVCYDNNIFFHVDAAFGGFLIPFLKDLGYDLPDFDFKLKGVSSLSVDGHKMGGCAIPLGFFLARREEWFKKIGVETPYVSTEYQSTILGTRPGAPVAYGYARLKLLGREGFIEQAKKCMELTNYTKEKLEEHGFTLFTEPTLNVIAVKVKDLDKVVRELYDRGWSVNPIRRFSSFRLVIMPHLEKEIIDRFIDDLRDVCKEVTK